MLSPLRKYIPCSSSPNENGHPPYPLMDKLRDIERGNGEFGDKPDANCYGCPKKENEEEFLKSNVVTGIYRISKHEYGNQECLSAFAHKLADRLGLFCKDDYDNDCITVQSTPFETSIENG